MRPVRGWCALATAIVLLGGCVRPVEQRLLLERTTSKWFILFGTEPSSGDTVVSGIFPRDAAILSSTALSDVGVLGWKELPPGLNGELDRPGQIVTACEPSLPGPDEAMHLDGRPLERIPTITGPWIAEGTCAPIGTAPVIIDSCALGQCSVEILAQHGCTFSGTLDRANCSLASELEGRVDAQGGVCVVLKSPLCTPDLEVLGLSTCRAEQKSCDLETIDRLKPLLLERRELQSHGPLVRPAVGQRVDAAQVPYDSEHLTEHLVAGMALGYASDAAVLGDQLVTLEHSPPLLRFGCSSTATPDLLRTYDRNLRLIATTTISACAARFAATSSVGFYVLHRSEVPTIALHARDGALVRERPLLGPGGCDERGAFPLAAAMLNGALYVALPRVDQESFSGLVLARLDPTLRTPATCAVVQHSTEPRLRTIMDFRATSTGKLVVSDSRAALVATFEPDGADVRVFKARSGLEGTDVGLMYELGGGIIAATLPVRAPALQFWDFRAQPIPEDFAVAHHPVWGQSPLAIGPYSTDHLLVSLWAPLGSTEVGGSVSLLHKATRRFEKRSADLGPGVPGAILGDPRGGSLVLMPWTGEIVRVLPE